MTDLERFAAALSTSRKIVGFTGAGVSTEAGIPDYRSQGGIWDRYTPVFLDEFINDEAKRKLYWERKKETWGTIRQAQPTRAHSFFVDLKKSGRLLGVITQNIDGLHEKSGIPPEMLVNLHGTSLEIVCLECGSMQPAETVMQELDPQNPPDCPYCGGLLKPNTISFGQQLVERDLRRAEGLARSCDLMIAAGSTLQVQPAASFPLIAKEAGARLAIITLSETPLDGYADFVFQKKLGDFLKLLTPGK